MDTAICIQIQVLVTLLGITKLGAAEGLVTTVVPDISGRSNLTMTGCKDSASEESGQARVSRNRGWSPYRLSKSDCITLR